METNFKYLYIRANNTRSSDIIKTLEDFGGKNYLHLIGYTSDPHSSLYYIDEHGIIKLIDITIDKKLYLSILREGKEVSFILPTDIYYYGDANRSKEIIKALEKLGGINKHYDCKDKNCIYFIGNNNVITGIMAGSSVATVIKRFYKKCVLPPIETIEIEGRKYKKEEVLEKLKDLKTY